MSYLDGPIREQDEGGKGRLIVLHDSVPIEELVSRIKRPGGHTNTERGYLPILASKLRTSLSEFACCDASPADERGECFSLSEEDRQLLEGVEIVVCGEDKHPLERV